MQWSSQQAGLTENTVQRSVISGFPTLGELKMGVLVNQSCKAVILCV